MDPWGNSKKWVFPCFPHIKGPPTPIKMVPWECLITTCALQCSSSAQIQRCMVKMAPGVFFQTVAANWLQCVPIQAWDSYFCQFLRKGKFCMLFPTNSVKKNEGMDVEKRIWAKFAEGNGEILKGCRETGRDNRKASVSGGLSDSEAVGKTPGWGTRIITATTPCWPLPSHQH